MATTLDPVKKDDIIVGLESGSDSSRTLYATWTYTNKNSLANGFIVRWQYYTIDKVWFTESESNVDLPVSGNRQSCQYSVPENAARVRFRVKPKPKEDANKSSYDGYIEYVFSKLQGTKTKIKAAQISINIANNSERDLIATWTYPEDDGVTKSFHVEWEYWLDAPQNDWYKATNPDEGEEVSYSVRYHIYSATDQTDKFRFRIKPDPIFEGDFEGQWSEYKTFTIGAHIPDRKIDRDDISISHVANTEKTIFANWGSAYDFSDSMTASFDVQWDYSTGQQEYFPGGSETINFPYYVSQYTPEDNAVRIRFRVKPNPIISSYFEGQWSNYAYFNISSLYGAKRQIKKQNLYIFIENGTTRNMVAKWDKYVDTDNDDKYTYDLSDGQTSGFECMWEYSSGSGWFAGATETIDVTSSTRIKDLESMYSAPENAKKVHFNIRPIPADITYFTGQWTTAVIYEFSSTKGDKAKITGITIGLESGTGSDRTLFATWAEGTNLATVRETNASTMISGQYGTQISTAKGDIIKLDNSNRYMALAPLKQPNIFIAGDKVDYSLYLRAVTSSRSIILRIYGYDSNGDYLGSVGKSISATPTSKSYSGTIDIKDSGDLVWSNVSTYSILLVDVENSEWQIGVKEVKIKRVPSYSVSDPHTDHFEVKWHYYSGDGVWFSGSETTVESNKTNCKYSAPTNAIRVRFAIRPISETYTANGMESTYFNGIWSSWIYYNFADEVTVETPSVPEVTINGTTLTAELDCYDPSTNLIGFYVVKNDSSHIADYDGYAKVIYNHVSFSHDVDLGNVYRVKCRAYHTSEKISTNNVSTIKSYDAISDWSEYSENVGTIPKQPHFDFPDGIDKTILKVLSLTEIRLRFMGSVTAASYEVQYTRDSIYFDHSTSEVQTTTLDASGGGTKSIIISNLTTGMRWFFRVRGVNEDGESEWSEVQTCVLGTTPSAPTTWNETASVSTSGIIRLYWVHNSEDDSEQSAAELLLKVGSNTKTVSLSGSTNRSYYYINIPNISDDDSVLSPLKVGGSLTWQVRTKGVVESFGNYSVERTVEIIAAPTISNFRLNTTDSEEIDKGLPFTFTANVTPTSQRISGYRLVITKASAIYENGSDKIISSVADITGKLRVINIGQDVYDKYFSVPSDDTSNYISITVNAGDFFPENGVDYTYYLTVYMQSGLTAKTATRTFTLKMPENDFDINANITVLKNKAATTIRPYCVDKTTREVIDGVLLYVYRREFDGTLTLIQGEYENTDPDAKDVYIVDPHPGLDYARYRIVAVMQDTGETDFVDLPGTPIGIKSIVIKWDEQWQNYEADSEDALEQLPIQGSMILLPYNIDISDTYQKDTSLINYIGRSNPVSYYGTQIGESSEWSVSIPATSTDLLYQLRKLAVYQGDVYVREPSGSGYWANITVSFSKNHSETTIPVKLNVKRVEGGK